MSALAVLYEHPKWFEPLFSTLQARGVDFHRMTPDGGYDPSAPEPPAPLIFNRIAMSAFLRDSEHPIFWAQSLLAQWELRGARVLNGAAALAIDTSKARQLALIATLGLAAPATRVVRRISDIEAAATEIGYPLLVKANIGGAGAGISRFDSRDELLAAKADDLLPTSIDGVLLVQEYIPARDGIVTRVETLDRQFLYAIKIEGAGAFDLCPADACQIPGQAILMTATDPGDEIKSAVEAIARAAHLDVGGVELMIDDRDGTPRFYDINGLSNFVAKPLDVLGWDPHERLVDRLVAWMEEVR